jgi:hypothetical protein
MQPLVQLLLTVAMYSIMGMTVGLGVILYRRYPHIGFQMQQHPVLGWALMFAAGSAFATVVFTVIEYAAILIISVLRLT